jgi:hypothetical protein
MSNKKTITFKFTTVNAMGRMENLAELNTELYRFSQVVDHMIYHHQAVDDPDNAIVFELVSNENDNNYIIPIAVANHPNDWTNIVNGVTNPEKSSVFEYLNSKYISDLQNKKAMLLLDQSVEGYNTVWLWEWFHTKCDNYGIDPSAIIYLTGDQSCSDSYDDWCVKNRPGSRLNVCPSTSLGMYIHNHYRRFNLKIEFNELLDYKRLNSNNIYLYDCINKRPRPQRILNFLHLINEGLIDYGNISMPSHSEWGAWVNLFSPNYLEKYNLPADVLSKLTESSTPRIAVHNNTCDTTRYYGFVERILDDMYKNSWVSLVVESSYFEYEHSTFISEKTFKPIACMQPFIIVGSKNTLKYLRKLGYKSFAPFIDESYDDLEDGDRFIAIMNSIKKIQAIEDKAAWYESMRDILEHNHKLFLSIQTRKSQEYEAVIKYYFNYFKE